jgi:hypothetical protein
MLLAPILELAVSIFIDAMKEGVNHCIWSGGRPLRGRTNALAKKVSAIAHASLVRRLQFKMLAKRPSGMSRRTGRGYASDIAGYRAAPKHVR